MARRLALLGWRGEATALARGVLPDESRWLAKVKEVSSDAFPSRLKRNLPDWVDEALALAMPPSELDALAASLLEPAPLDLRVNTLRGSREQAQAAADGEVVGRRALDGELRVGRVAERQHAVADLAARQRRLLLRPRQRREALRVRQQVLRRARRLVGERRVEAEPREVDLVHAEPSAQIAPTDLGRRVREWHAAGEDRLDRLDLAATVALLAPRRERNDVVQLATDPAAPTAAEALEDAVADIR
jgi:hypothetical protein